MRTFALRAIALLMLPGLATAANFTSWVDLPGVSAGSRPTAIAADGSAIVGFNSSSASQPAFRWTSSGGMVGLGTFYPNAEYTVVSTDGTTLVADGWFSSETRESVRWTSGTGWVGLASAPYDTRRISADGKVIVGIAPNGSGFGQYQVNRWTQDGGWMGLGYIGSTGAYSPPSATYPLPRVNVTSGDGAISANGNVVVGGNSWFNYGGPSPGGNTNGSEAYRWTQDGGMVGLGDLPGGQFNSYATGVSANGNVVVGSSSSASGEEAFRWTQGGGMSALGDLPGGIFDSRATAASDDGTVVMGTGTSAVGQEAFMWTQANGMQRLFDVLVSNGATGLAGWKLESVLGMSADGKWVLGQGTDLSHQSKFFLANLSTVPIPPAVWLFGSALGVMGWMRRKAN